MTNEQRIEIAKHFIALHKHSVVEGWQPMNKFGDDKYLHIFFNMVNSVYGVCRVDLDSNIYELEINSTDNRFGHSYLFTWKG